MKKLVIMAALALSSVGAFAQQAVGTWSVTPKVGMNIANITDGNGDPRIGLVAGGEVEYQATDMVSITAGALYSMQGAKDKTDGITTTVKMDYVNVPILANVYVAKGLAVKLGIQPGFNVNAKANAEGYGREVSVDIKDAIKTVDISIPVGISYEYMNFVIDARYNWGLTNVSKNKTLEYGDEYIDFGGKGKNSVFQITLGYKIPF